MRCSTCLLLATVHCIAIGFVSAVPIARPVTYSDPAHEIYGWGPMYPNTSLGGLIVEGPFPYKNGPAIWNDTFTSGAYGWVWLTTQSDTDKGCPPIPANLAVDHKSVLGPYTLKQHGSGELNQCFIGCNITLIEEGGKDPCTGATVHTRAGPEPMSCFFGGPGFTGDATLGICGFNCTARLQTPPHDFCHDADLRAGKCYIYCDPDLSQLALPVSTTSSSSSSFSALQIDRPRAYALPATDSSIDG